MTEACEKCGSYFEYVNSANEIVCADCGALKGLVVHTHAPSAHKSE